MKKLSNTEAELKKALLIKTKVCTYERVLQSFSEKLKEETWSKRNSKKIITKTGNFTEKGLPATNFAKFSRTASP